MVIIQLLIHLALFGSSYGLIGSRSRVSECQGTTREEGWVKYPEPVYGGGPLGTCFDAVFALDKDPVSNEITYKMYLSWRTTLSIALTTSHDGIHWDQNPIVLLPPVEHSDHWEADVNRPFVLQLNGTYHMWYTGQSPSPALVGKLGYASSVDGLKWSRREQPIMVPTSPWEKASIMCTHVIYDAEKSLFRMWYSAGDKYEPDAIGYAVSTDGLHWDRAPENPIFTKNSADSSAFDSSVVTCPHIIYDGRYYNMFYIGFKGINAAIGLARSKDGITNWERHPHNPVIAPTVGGWDSTATYKPYALHNGTHWLLWYNGRTGGLERIGLATLKTHGDDIYNFGFDTPDPLDQQRCKIGKKNAVNSQHMMEQIATFPADWRKPLVISAIADEKYINSVQMFVESFLAFGYGINDLSLVCTSVACSEAMVAHNIPHELYIEPLCAGNLRCLISSAKISAVIDTLHSGASVFFFDLDVYFKADPLTDIAVHMTRHRVRNNNLTVDDQQPMADMIVNYNGDKNKPNNNLNFGVFLIRPCSATEYMFAVMFRRLHGQGTTKEKWDQLLFNDAAIKWAPISYTYFPDQYHVFDPKWHSYDVEAMKSLHMVCVEGAENKLLLARHHFGPFYTPEYYTGKQTVAIDYLHSYSKQPQLLAGVIAVAVHVARSTGRYVRLQGWPGYNKTVSLFDADRLLADGVVLVEPQYWHHASKLHAHYDHSSGAELVDEVVHESKAVTVTSLADLGAVETDPQYLHSAEIHLQLPDPLFLGLNLWSNSSRYLCARRNAVYSCLQTCQGVHFR